MKKQTYTVETQMAALAGNYLNGLTHRAIKLGKIWQEIAEDPEQGKESVIILEQLLQGLAGAATTFGYPQLSDQAAELLQLLAQQKATGGRIRQLVGQPFERLLLALVATMKQPPMSCYPPLVQETVGQPCSLFFPALDPSEIASPLIYVLEDDWLVAEELTLALDEAGYNVSMLHEVEAFLTALAVTPPDGIIVAMDFGGSANGGAHLIETYCPKAENMPPLFFLTSRDDFETRLCATRAGAAGYLVKPLQPGLLVERLDSVLRRWQTNPYRVVVVEDDELLATQYGLLLTDAGMDVKVITRPKNAIRVFIEHRPELILLDLDMPECSGLELAKILRQQDAYLGVAIIFLSLEGDRETRFRARMAGGDDLLCKPLSNEQLVGAVMSRAERIRRLTQLMALDTLTGLVKAEKVDTGLSGEIGRAHRTGDKMSFVYIDIDQFEAVNSRRGHMSGDAVLKGLAQLLIHRLRHSDLVGRYGRDLFALVLPHCDLESAMKIVDNIRHDFKSMPFSHNDKYFSVTFSAGIAGYPLAKTADQVKRLARIALANAKDKGRNQVVVANIKNAKRLS